MNAPESASVVLTRKELDALNGLVRQADSYCKMQGLSLEDRVALIVKLKVAEATLPELEVPF